MSGPGGWTPRRFWTEARAEPEEGGRWVVRLDARLLRTPARAPLLLPSAALASAIAAEWAAQGERVEPRTMPLTRAANAAIDRVAPDPAPVIEEIAGWGAADLLCYRAAAPVELARRQAAAWDPFLDWAAGFGARLSVTAGVVHTPQPEASLAALRARVAAQDAFGLVALSELVALSGSLVLGLAALEGRAAPEALWETARLDETWQAELWGRDPEAEAAAADRRRAFLDAARFFRLARGAED